MFARWLTFFTHSEVTFYQYFFFIFLSACSRSKSGIYAEEKKGNPQQIVTNNQQSSPADEKLAQSLKLFITFRCGVISYLICSILFWGEIFLLNPYWNESMRNKEPHFRSIPGLLPDLD